MKERFDAAPTTVQQASANPNAARESANLARDVVLAAGWHARSATLNRFMGEAAVSGQLGLMYSRLQNQLAEVVRLSRDTDTAAIAFERDKAVNSSNPQLPLRFYNLLTQRGAEQGAAEELLTITNDVKGYERDYSGAATVDRRRQEDAERRVLAYLSATRVEVQAPTYVQAPPPAPRLTTCLPNIFGSVNCFSN